MSIRFGLLVSVFFLIFSDALSQSMTRSSTEVDLTDLFNMVNSNVRHDAVEGSRYYFNDFEKGNINFKANKSFKDASIRLDLLNTTVEVKKDDKIYVVGNNDNIKNIELAGTKFVIREFKDKKNLTTSFYSLKQIENVELLIRQKIEFKEGKKSTSSYSDDKPPKFTKEKEKLFIKFGEENLIEIASNRKFKKSLDLLEDKSLYNFYTENNLKIKKEKDRNKLIEYFNQKN